MLLLTAEQMFMELPFINVNHVEKSTPATDLAETDTALLVRIIKQNSGFLNNFRKNLPVIIL